jgi:hypothetical protein
MGSVAAQLKQGSFKPATLDREAGLLLAYEEMQYVERSRKAGWLLPFGCTVCVGALASGSELARPAAR